VAILAAGERSTVVNVPVTLRRAVAILAAGILCPVASASAQESTPTPTPTAATATATTASQATDPFPDELGAVVAGLVALVVVLVGLWYRGR
jgi:hypothetical protein